MLTAYALAVTLNAVMAQPIFDDVEATKLALYEYGQAATGQPAAAAITQDSRLDRKVTKSFDNVTLGEILQWLAAEGINFVIRDSEMTRSKVSLNLKDEPLRDAVDAIADAFNGEWRKKGNVYVFHEVGLGSWTTRAVEGLPMTAAPFMDIPAAERQALERSLKLAEPAQRVPGVELEIPDIAMEPLSKAQQEALAEGMKLSIPEIADLEKMDIELGEVQGHELSKAQRAEMEAHMKQMKSKLAKLKGKKMSEKDRKALEEHMRVMEREHEGLARSIELSMPKIADMEKLHMELGEVQGHELSKAQRAEMEAHMRDMKSHLQQLKGMDHMKMLEHMQNMKGNKKMSEKDRKAFEEHMKQMEPMFKELGEHLSKMPFENMQFEKMKEGDWEKFGQAMEKWGEEFGKSWAGKEGHWVGKDDVKFFHDEDRDDEDDDEDGDAPKARLFRHGNGDDQNVVIATPQEGRKVRVEQRGEGKNREIVIVTPQGEKRVRLGDGKEGAFTYSVPGRKGTFVITGPKGKSGAYTIQGKGDGKALTFTVPGGKSRVFAVPGGPGKDFHFVVPGKQGFMMPPMPPMPPMEGIDMRRVPMAMPAMPAMPAAPIFVMTDSNVKRLMASLTPEQKRIQRSRGYLKASDLSQTQRAMLGGFTGSKNWSVSYEIDGQKLSVKSG